MTTATEADNKAVHDQADKSKANLNEGVAAHVPSTEAVAPGRAKDPFGDRKALFEKANARNNSEAQRVQEDNPSVRERVEAMEAEARGGRPPAQAPAPAPAPAPGSSGQNENPYITITHNGRQLSVSRLDIEAAGGEHGYLRQLELDDMDARFAEQTAAMQRQREQLEAEAADLKRRQEEFQRSQTVAREAPATGNDGTSLQGRNGPAAGADEQLEADANRLVEQLFNGDPAEAAKAVKQILAARQPSARIPSAEEVAELAAAKLRATQPEPKPQPEARPTQPANVDPRWERTRQAINTMAEREFPDIAKDPNLSAKARVEISRLYQLPQNKDRRAVDVAREACQLVKAELGRQQRIEVKQGLPSVPSAGGSAPAPADDNASIPVGSDYVRMMQDRRNFGPRNRQ